MQFNRRSFLKYLGLGIVAVPVLGKLPKAFAADAALPLVKESDPQAKALKFCINADKPTASCPDRKKPEKKGEYCSGCQLFTRTEGEGNKGKGKCMIMPKNSVPANGWCMSWVKKA